MYISKIKIKNYRLLIDAELEVDAKTTLIVGRNNTAKTSCLACIENVLNGHPFSFDDYPLVKRKTLYEIIASFMAKEISFESLCEQLEPISIEFFVDYSLEDLEDNLGALSPFIIDVDVDTTTALIRVEFRLKPDEKVLWRTLEESYYPNGVFVPSDEARDVISTNFSKLFELVIYAVNPKNPKETQIKKHKELEELFPFHIIPAERLLGEDGTQNSSLSSLISEFFEMNEEELDPSVAEKVKELRAIVEKANKNVQKQSDSILSSLVNDSVGFGYPNGEELQLGVTTQLSIDDQIKNQTQLSYTAGDFSSQKYKLPAQYYTIIEIGGAYAYKFIPFIEFLGIPCLILTDVDSVLGQEGKNGQIYYKSVPVSCGETTSNETLKWWVRKNKGLSNDDKTQIDLADIISMSSDDKTRGKCHIEFQTKENELCGHSLEEAIRNVNRSHYGLSDSPTEDDLEFSGKCKTDFALKLIYECTDYNIPTYIRSGLIWLNNQKVLE